MNRIIFHQEERSHEHLVEVVRVGLKLMTRHEMLESKNLNHIAGIFCYVIYHLFDGMPVT